MKFWSRIISFVLALSMVLSMIPGGTIHAHAEESTHEDHNHGEQAQEAPSSETAEAHTHTYENGICTGCGKEDPDGLKLDGLNVLCLGDSITAGQGLTTDTRWTNVLASKYGWNLTNKSQGGISLSSYYYTANGKSDVSIAKKAEVLKTMTTKPDVIIVWGGHNDTSYRYSPLGTWDDETTDSFKGALKYIAELADEYAPDATLFVLTPLWNNENPSTLKVPEGTTDTNWMFVDAIYDGAEAYGWIPINMDLCGITPFTKTGLLLDNIHPNEAGTEKIVEYLSEELASYGANSRKQTILFNHSSVSIENGKTTTLKAVLSPRSGNGSSVFTWSSSNSSVATVDANGKITAVAHGNTTITVTADNDVSATVQVSVAEGEHTYESTVTAPTCTEQGYTTYTCTCGDSYVDSYTDALGHSYQNRVCTICGAEAPALAGKTISILGASISTFAGTSNGAAADTTNSTIRNNVKYYPNATVTDVTLNDTWWMQVCDDLGLRLLVNNSWSGSSLLYERNGTVGAYVDRCVQLHDDTGDNAGEMPDIIGIQMGTNDFQYYKDTLGTADIDYDALITANGDGTYTYATPVTSLEAAAIVLHKISVRYPDAEVYYLNISQRVDGTDELIRSFNADLKQVVEHFGAHIVDIYGSAITMEAFDTYIGDGRVHPNCLGMDAYTEAFKRALVENTGYRVETHTVSLDLDGVTADYGDDKLVVDGDSFTVKLTASDSLQVTVTMGGEDITASAYANGTVTIGAVTADVTVTARSVYTPKNYRWEFDGTDLVCVSGGNPLTKNAGTTTDGVFSKTRYALETAVLLSHDRPWVVEWKCQGTFLNSNGSSGARIFTSTDVNAEYNARYIFKSNTNGIIAMGEKTSTGSHNYGIALADHGIDWTQLHTYRLENRIAEDGSNMIWLYVDGVEIGPMVNYYVGTTDKKTTSDWLSGKDFVFPYMGTDTHGFSNASIDYIAVWENGHIHTYENGICTSCGAEDPNAVTETLSLRYDDHYDVTGKTVEIIDAGVPTSYKVGYGVVEGTLDDAVITLEGNYLVATGIGTAQVRIDGTLYEVTVEKTKISIVVIMGQSNAGNHFANATSDVTCPLGTAYWWKNGATEPVDYTQPSMGFHTPLVAELYAQSVVAGDPVKNVMVWQEGVTSKNGQSIVKWAASETDTSGTDGTATMIKNCIAYYEKNSDLYEIVNCGVYWLQGESDVSMSPEKYTGLFMTMWNKLKDAGAEYLAFFRVRCGTTGNTSEHHDLGYTGSLTAQLQMINDNADMFMASTVTENWEGNETTEHSVDIRNYITLMEEYGTADTINDSYGNTATIKDGILTTTMKTLYGSNNKCHYGKFGYGIIGADAAYNMYHALHTDEFSIVQTDTSGKATAATISKPGAAVTIDITEMTENLAFRASCGSAAGTLDIKVKSGNTDITEKVIATGVNDFGTVDTQTLREYEDVTIVVTYTTVDGDSGSVVYTVVDNTPEPPNMYFWDFENDLYARDENGEVVNSFGETALNGSYVIENGMLKGNSLQLALGKQLKLCGDENWSIEWKFGEVTANTTGFLLCNTEKSAIGTKAVYFSIVGNVMVSDYKNSKGYYNYFTEEATFASGDCIKITNTYDSENGKSVLSLWKNGKLIVSDLQKKGYINSSTYGTYDMSTYPLSGDFVFNYLGCTGLQYFPVTGEIDYLKIIPEEENAESLSLRYDDHYDVTGKVVEIIDAGTPTSYKVGYGVAEGTLDDAVITLEGNYLVATGIGTAYVRIDGTLYEVTVTAAPISLLLIIGQSNAEGMVGRDHQSIACENGQVYSTYAKANGLTGDAGLTVENAGNYVPSALTGQYSTVNVNGTDTKLSGYPVNSLTEAGAGKYGMDSGIAYEWVKQTGEKVWVINAAHGASSISSWQPGQSNFEEANALLDACQKVLMQEIAAGHFTFSHMGYYWCQGCADETKTAQWYAEQYITMHNALKTETALDADRDPVTPDSTMEFGGIVLVMAGHENAVGYRMGTYSDSSDKFFATFKELEMRGPRVAQIWMANNPELPDIHLVCTLAQDWVTMPDGSDGVAEYFAAHYENGIIDYPTQVTQAASWYTPTTPAAVKDSIHYYQVGYNEVGRESVRNTLYILGLAEKPNVETTITFVDWTGYQMVDTIKTSTVPNSGTLVVPVVYPCYESKNVAYTFSDGLVYSYYDLLDTGVDGGTLTASIGSQAVQVIGRDYYAYRFELVNGNMVSVSNQIFRENPLTQYAGQKVYTTAEPIILKHDKLWMVEFNSVDTARFMAMATTPSSTEGMLYFFKSASNSGVLSIGEYKDGLYQNYGLLQSRVGIDWNEPHIYRFQNVLNEDGTNTIHIYIDDVWMGTATELIINGVSKGTDNMYLSGKDFVFTSIGCSGFGLSTGQMTYLEVWEYNCDHAYQSVVTAPTCTEQGYTTHTCTLCGDSYVDTYVPATGQHTYGDWVAVTVPTETALGLDQRSCSVCGHTETREVEGSWQKYDLAAHLLELPKNVCCDTNLWPILPHEDVHFTSGKTWGKTGTPTTSITIPLNPGDRVYATSWNKAGENGHDIQNGIRLTFFDAYGIALTLGPGESYSKFAANGGYLEAPEGTIAINIVMWYDSADYEVFILNREHAYEQVTVDPTCTERGYTGTVCLGCGAGTIDSYVDALGHDLTDFAAKAPTCTESGWNAYETCSRCDYTTYQELAAVGHSYGAWIQVTAPTCNAEGRDKSICQNCSEIIYRDTRISGDPNKVLVSNPLAENWFEGKIIMAIGDSLTAGSGVTVEERYHYLTAQALGMTNINCGTSGATLCPGGHLPNKFETWMNAKELIKRDVDIVTIFLGINDWDNGVVNGTYQGKLKYDESLTYYDLGEFGTDDTTTIYGAAKMWCERILELQATEGCEHIQFVFITPVITSYNKSVTNARDWNQNKVNVFGYTLRQYCTAIMEVCAYYNIPVLDQNMYSGMYYHSEEDNNVAYFGGDGIHPGANGHAMMAESLVEFLLEGYTYEERTVADCGHDYEEIITDPTCTEGGYTTYRCPACYYSYVGNHTQPTGHDYKSVVTAPTCTERGYTTHTCTTCGDSYVDSYVNPTGHKFGNWAVVKATTCTEDGTERRDCQNCDHYETRTITAAGHDYKSVVTDPTCTERGYTTHTCSKCGHSYIDSYVNATSHKFGSWVVTKAATCTEDGQERRDCTNCGHYETRTVEATGHDYKSVVTAPTCTEKGYTTHTCTVCGNSYVDTYVDATGHKYGSWTVTKKATCTEDGTERRDCANCDHYETRTIEATGHNYKSVVTAPTCTEKGYTTHTCTACGDSYKDSYVNPTGHKFGNWTVVKAATCTEDGTERRDCQNCDHYETRTIKATGHNYKSVVTAPTCTEKGYTTHTCTNCGDSYVDSYVNPTGHKFGNWVVTKNATCTEEGQERRDCTNCDHYETRTIEATGHNYKSVVTAPTCTEQGYTTHTCTKCGDKYVDTYVPALGHHFVNYVSDGNATCIEDGTKTAKCERCDAIDTVVDRGSATGHKFGNWFVVKAATCTEDGQEQRDCANCDHYETRTIKATGHNYKSVVTAPTCTEQGYTTHTCTVCGNSYVDSYVDATGHKFGNWTVVKAATCTEDGSERRDCANCDHYETRTIKATGHDYKSVVTAPTCTEQGYTTHTCTACGDSYVDTYVPALGHSYGEWYQTKAPTYEADGEERRDCTRCGEYQTRVVPMLKHEYVSVVTEPTCTEQGYTTHTCTKCGDSYVDTFVAALGHNFVTYVSDGNATCTEDGTKTAKCERCDATDTVVDRGSATGHKFGNWVVTKNATCTEDGQERRDCANCDHYETRTVEATGHDYKSVVTAPTCTERGYTTHTCSVCGDSYVDSYVNPTGHKFGNWVVTKNATCTEDGTERRDCVNCDHYETRTIEATGHNYKLVVTAPTCTERGYTTHTCSVCGNSYVDSYVNATGHKFGNWVVTKNATCTENGQERQDCANCDHYETRTIKATGHNYESVVTAPTCTEQGYTTHTCSKCGDSYVDTYVPALGHSFGPWEVIIEPETGKMGLKQRVCAHCGHTETEEIPALDFLFGDTNSDGKVNGKDLILLRQSLAGWDVTIAGAAADCNGDGKINGKDLILLRQYLAGWDVELG
ncbi:MAG: Ig-like domain-containing protein [Oscillospiraceae bacterium]|nr:Ig-like domain-containing protein [Oscillospiraceae bacterium]